MRNPSSMAGVAMAMSAAALWGTTGTAQSFAPAQTSPYWVGALRLAIAGLFFAAVIAHRRSDRPAWRLPAGAWHRVLLVGACVAAYNLCFFAGVKATGIAVGTAIAVGSGPVWAGLLQSLALRRPPESAWWLGTLLAVGGGCLMVIPWSNAAGTQVDPFGLALCLAGGLAYAGYVLLSQPLVNQAPPATVTFWTFVVATLIALPAALAVSGPFTAAPADWAILVYLGLVSTGLAYLLFSHALRRISGASGVTLALVEPVTAFALAVLVVREQPAAAAFAGLALVLAGLMLVVWTETRNGAA